jgi:hypothetical protein
VDVRQWLIGVSAKLHPCLRRPLWRFIFLKLPPQLLGTHARKAIQNERKDGITEHKNAAAAFAAATAAKKKAHLSLEVWARPREHRQRQSLQSANRLALPQFSCPTLGLRSQNIISSA